LGLGLALLTTHAHAASKIKSAQPTQPAPPTYSNVVEEDWKGTPETNRFEVGVLSGLGVVDSSAGFALLPTAAAKILDHGFIGDINNTAFIETEMGPLFLSGRTPF